ncbi:MAG: hypothetical protein AAF195_02955, partial [Pseudomonadota bacterium]
MNQIYSPHLMIALSAIYKALIIETKYVPYMGNNLFNIVQNLNLRPERKQQIYQAFIDFYNKSKQHVYVKENIISPNLQDITIDGKHHTSLNIDRGSKELPIFLSLIDQIKFNDNPKITYGSTYVLNDIKNWHMPKELWQEISSNTPEEIKKRPSGWPMFRDRGDKVHEPFMQIASYNVMQLCEDFKFKQHKKNISLNDLCGAKLLTSLDQADMHNIAIRIIFSDKINKNGTLDINIEIIDSVAKESAHLGRPGQEYDYENNLKRIIKYYIKDMLCSVNKLF